VHNFYKQNLLLLILVFVFSFLPEVKAGFVDITNPLEGTYNFSGTDSFGNEFDYSITFDLWEDLSAGLYQYKYSLTNLIDASGAEVQDININHVAPLETVSWDPGSYAPIGYQDNGSTVTFVWWPWVPSGSTTTWFWFTSYGPPGLLDSLGDASLGASAAGKLPAPVPEPSTVILLIMGLFVSGVVSKFIEISG